MNLRKRSGFMLKAAYYITTPIYYVNDKPHIGHAYTSLACDVMARFKRMEGASVHFLTGTDEHGQKIEQSALKRGMEPQSFTDEVSKSFRKLADIMNFSHDDFIRTTEERHKEGARALWTRLQDKGMIYKGSYEGWYAVSDEAFYNEDETQLREDGKRYALSSGKEVQWLTEPSYFFKLSAMQERLLEHYERCSDFIMPDARRNEVVSFVKSGLKDLSISRTSFRWGITVPENEKHVMYVWLDALSNYMSALGYPDEQSQLYRKFWPASIHVVGKDILRFHAVYWPAFLMAAELPLPKRVFAHGWWTNEGQKISKSLGNVIDPFKLVESYGLDQVRYFLLREVPFGKDGDFSVAALLQRVNSDLSNAYGNLAQRVLSMIHKNCMEKMPRPGPLQKIDQKLLSFSNETLLKTRDHMSSQAFHKALEAIWLLVSEANVYTDETAPWALKKSDEARMSTVLYVLANIIRRVSLMAHPFMPESTQRLLVMLGEGEGPYDFERFDDMIQTGISIIKPQAVFPRYVQEI